MAPGTPSLRARYQAVHRPGQDCRVTCMRNLLELAGTRLTYHDVQGLASCFFFVYRRRNLALDRLLFPEGNFEHRFWVVAGQRLDVMENIAYLFNAALVTDRRQDDDAACEAIRPYLAEGLPVLVAINRVELLRHLGEPMPDFEFLGDLVFGGHWVAVTEIDDAKGSVWIHETDREEPIELPLEVLARLRTAGDDAPGASMRSLNRWAVFRPPAAPPPDDFMVRTAVTKVVHNLRSAANALPEESGIEALEAFCRELPDWPQHPELDGDRLRATVYMMYMTSENLSAGGMGRRSFGLFLRAASRRLGDAHLRDAAFAYGDASRAWRKLLTILADRTFRGEGGRPDFGDAAVRGLLATIRDQERLGLEALERSCGVQELAA